MGEPTLQQMGWQLRSNSLALEGGHVVLYPPMLRTATPEALAVVAARAAAINAIIDRDNLHPVNLSELITYFNELENLP